MYSGLDFIDGYSALRPCGLEVLMGSRLGLGSTTEYYSKRVLVTESGPTGLLRLFGVDGLIVTNRFASFEPSLRANGWKPVATFEGGKVFRRDGPPSLRVRARGGRVPIEPRRGPSPAPG